MATLGKPSISDVKNLDIRSITVAISNIRQRIEAVETELGTTTSTAQQAASTSNTQFNTLRQQLALLQQALATLTIVVNGIAVDSEDSQIAARVFAARNPYLQAPAPEDGVNQIANQAFARRLTLPDNLAVNDASRMIAAQIFGA